MKEDLLQIGCLMLLFATVCGITLYEDQHYTSQIMGIVRQILYTIFIAQCLSFAVTEDGVPKVDPLQPLEQALTPNNGTEDDWAFKWIPSPEIRKAYPVYLSGYDDDGLPVYVLEYGHWDYKSLGQQSDEYKQNFNKFFDQMIQRFAKDGSKNEHQGIVLITDFVDFSLGNFASSKALQYALGQFSSITKVNSAVKYGFLINTNFGAQSFLNIARPFLGNILEKFEVDGTHADKWKPKLLRKIPSSQLPPFYGGDKDYKPIPWNDI